MISRSAEGSVMADTARQQLSLLAKLIVTSLIVLVIAGAVWHGVTVANFKRIWFQELARPSGPMKFRFVLQPLMAAIFAARDGLKDARTGRPPFFWAMLY